MFDQCPHAFYLRYILKLDEVQNAYSQFGTLVHDILEKWADGRLKASELAEEFKERHDKEVTADYPMWPQGQREKSFDKVYTYLKSFDGFGDEYEITATEKHHVTTIGGCKFQGVVDLGLLNTNTKENIIIDHKSKSIASLNKDKLAYRQLYTYAKFFYDVAGKFPDWLMFHLFKENGVLAEYKFDKEAYSEVMDWLEGTMALISMEDEWKPVYEKFFCTNLCGVRNHCEEALIRANG